MRFQNARILLGFSLPFRSYRADKRAVNFNHNTLVAIMRNYYPMMRYILLANLRALSLST